jgi:hypothetical protein
VSEHLTQSPRREALVASERMARERYQLYRARVYGPRATSLDRLRQLDHAWELAESRLHRARAPALSDKRAAALSGDRP